MINLKLSDDLKNELLNEAKAIGLSLTAYIRMLLIERKK